MTHGEKMSVLGKIIALQEVMLHTQNEINKLNKLFSRALSNKYLIFLIKNFIKEV